MFYQGVKRFSPDEKPHAAKCECPACLAYLAVITRLNPARLTEDDETGQVYVRNAEKKPRPTKGLTWNDPNRPYVLANQQSSASLWRGGVYTQVRSAVTGNPAPISDTRFPRPTAVSKRDTRTAREKRMAKRMTRFKARNAQQIVSSAVIPYKGTRKELVSEIRSNNLAGETRD